MTISSSPGGNIPQSGTGSADGYMFFNAGEVRTLDAMTARIMPSEPDGRGAREAGVVTYLDRAVAGYFRDLQSVYRVGVQRLDAYSLAKAGGIFPELSAAQQDEILAQLDTGRGVSSAGESVEARDTNGSDAILARFFAIVREHTIQGMFCDPIYGGNRDYTGWKLIGFPGAQWEYTEEQMRAGFDATTIPILSLADLQRPKAPRHD
ncbi:gluconate 2-dehydrogenase subunit 3 family protein [Rhizobium rosettiformans]|uniref:gluconate 2-dehydrogenase subunit 3 family protein n=1 Tax=Rhizobium rosettiformans TaxID=1368430 RepID=UPI0028658EE5|nr:gluconate 2-dehydrogenase subunit 3 family protein [Rhizobium rosettiformans]MDR7031165.1 gluconate 2-dehydrogenase gamma chain [Rhizobium rosettiformans]MDR7066730.1 gluconate 2-dehydrogenase gamma chain [Rhizobium rosettiformans]